MDMYKVNDSRCTGCGSCVDACPVGAIKVVDKKAQINQDECIECGACQADCLNKAIDEE